MLSIRYYGDLAGEERTLAGVNQLSGLRVRTYKPVWLGFYCEGLHRKCVVACVLGASLQRSREEEEENELKVTAGAASSASIDPVIDHRPLIGHSSSETHQQPPPASPPWGTGGWRS